MALISERLLRSAIGATLHCWVARKKFNKIAGVIKAPPRDAKIAHVDRTGKTTGVILLQARARKLHALKFRAAQFKAQKAQFGLVAIGHTARLASPFRLLAHACEIALQGMG
jgi:hypothetical protein